MLASVRPIPNLTAVPATNLFHLSPTSWRIIGQCNPERQWSYHGLLGTTQHAAYVGLRDNGVLLTTQRREGDHWVLLCKIADSYRRSWPTEFEAMIVATREENRR